MEEKDYFLAHLKDLANKASKESIITSSQFLSLSEQSIFLKEFPSFKKSIDSDIEIILDGGNKEDSDRKIIFFKPSFYSEDNFLEFKNETITLLYVSPKNEKFGENLTHRDVLGALMNLGIKRETIGDIIVNYENKKEVIIYILSLVKNEVITNLTKIRNTNINIKEINLIDAPFKPHFVTIDIYVSSLRLDNVIKEVFNLSRNDAQEIIEKEYVFINGESKTSPSYQLKAIDRVSIKSKGKFIFLDESTINKKGKYHTKIKKYD